MRILELRFKNLNSLYGEWRLDFTAFPLSHQGIFAITGPTGAGKSTILDAICLALYGATPRLGRISRRQNEIMSRRTGECFAEIIFESVSGRFRCHWSQHRAHKKADGNLIEARHEIVDADTDRILETKKRGVARLVERHTGMDFDRFTRSILLAQGDFAAFLQASPDKRAPVLEQITGTGIYSKISQLVHERSRAEHDKLQRLRLSGEAVELLGKDEINRLERKLRHGRRAKQRLLARQQQIIAAIQWLTDLQRLERELQEASSEARAVEAAWNDFAGERESLLQASKAAELEGDMRFISEKRRLRKENQAALQDLEQRLPRLQQQRDEQQNELREATTAKDKAAAALEREREIITRVRDLDSRIDSLEKELHTTRGEFDTNGSRLARHTRRRQEILEQWQHQAVELAEKEEYLSRHQRDRLLVAGLAGIREQFGVLQAMIADIDSLERGVKVQRQKVEEKTRLHASRQQSLELARQRCDRCRRETAAAKENLAAHLNGRLLREYRAEHERLQQEMIHLQRIATLEEDRRRLRRGDPCPLCGSLHHPYGDGQVPEISGTEKKIRDLKQFLRIAEQLENVIEKLKDEEQQAANRYNEADKQYAASKAELAAASREQERLTTELSALRDRCHRLQRQTLAGLQELEIDALPLDRLDHLLHSLSQRLSRWQSHQTAAERIREQLADKLSRVKELDGGIRALVGVLRAKQPQLLEIEETLAALRKERRNLYGDKVPDREEKRLLELLAVEKNRVKSLERACLESEPILVETKTRINALTAGITSGKEELERCEKQFAALLRRAGFADERTFLAKQLSPEKRKELQQRHDELSAGLARATARRKDRWKRLQEVRDKKPTTLSPEELGSCREKIDLALQRLGEKIGAVKQRLRDNEAAALRLRKHRELIEAAQRECSRWDRLHGLIGSADGKKYRNFAQGITFELMIAHANRQLVRMTDRYLLIRDPEQPLELNVIDNYQAGEIRSTKNLSGGESFIVSLALALGLSRMAGRRVRVDSLFLDEGFGTLDEEALETALETLAGLRRDGKLIGVISHVPALRERIPSRIAIIPRSGGRSIIRGPGCERLS